MADETVNDRLNADRASAAAAERARVAETALPNQVKAEEASLTRETQALDTERVMRQRRFGGQSNDPTGADPEPNTAAALLRAFEDDRFGEDAVRIGDRIEQGSGSPYSQMSDADKLHYTALERLVIAEKKFEDAQALAAQAESDMATAEENLVAAEKAAEDARSKADEQARARQARLDARSSRQPAPVV